jgi:predicted ATPase
VIKGFSISQYKSFAINPTHIGPLSKINLFIGQNNSGKSNIISFLMERYSHLLSSALGQGQNIPPLGPLDVHQGESDWKTRFSIGVDFQSADFKKYLESLQSRNL